MEMTSLTPGYTFFFFWGGGGAEGVGRELVFIDRKQKIHFFPHD